LRLKERKKEGSVLEMYRVHLSQKGSSKLRDEGKAIESRGRLGGKVNKRTRKGPAEKKGNSCSCHIFPMSVEKASKHRGKAV